MRKTTHLVAFGLLLLTSCDSGHWEYEYDPALLVTLAPNALSVPRACTQIESILRDQAEQEYQNALKQAHERSARLDEQCATCKKTNCTKPRRHWVEHYDGDLAAASPTAGNTRESADAPRAQDYTTTNTQVSGVDEADFVKNDDQYIYVADGNTFKIVRAWPAAQMQVVQSVQVPGKALKVYVNGNRALVYSRVSEKSCNSDDPYRYNDDYYPGRSNAKLLLSFFDINDRTHAPTLERTIELPGELLQSRRIGSRVYTVSTAFVVFTKEWQAQYPTFYRNACGQDYDMEAFEQDLEQRYQARLAEISELVKNLPLTAAVSKQMNADNSITETGLTSCELLVPNKRTSNQLFSVLTTNIDAASDVHVTHVLGSASTVYASTQGLYIAGQHSPNRDEAYISDWSKKPWFQEATDIHYFSLPTDTLNPAYQGSGVVPGRLVNQFALDEHDAQLRVATTEGYISRGKTTSNNLYVLKQEAQSLNVIAAIKGIAEGEDIRSVRYVDNRAYMVTFKKTDPLYTFQFDEQGLPKQTGALKIPGFSTYMHPLDETHLLTIGFDAEDKGDFAWFSGLSLQIFDVQGEEAKLLHKESIGTRGSSSDATANHLAFTYYANKKMLAIPAGICEGGDASRGLYGSTLSFNGLLVYDIDIENGFRKIGGVDHRNPGDETPRYGCGSWWETPNSTVKRSIFMSSDTHDFVYSVSGSTIKANEVMGDPRTVSADISQVDLAAPTQNLCE